MSKTTLWYVHLFGDVVRVGRERLPGASRVWRVRSIAPRAAARRLIRGGTIAEAVAKFEFEWDNPMQPQRDDSPAQDRERWQVKERVCNLRIEVVRE